MNRIHTIMGRNGTVVRISAFRGHVPGIFRFSPDTGWFNWNEINKRNLYLEKYSDFPCECLENMSMGSLLLQMGNYYRKKKDRD